MDGSITINISLSLLIYLIIRIELLTYRVSKLESKVDKLNNSK